MTYSCKSTPRYIIFKMKIFGGSFTSFKCLQRKCSSQLNTQKVEKNVYLIQRTHFRVSPFFKRQNMQNAGYLSVVIFAVLSCILLDVLAQFNAELFLRRHRQGPRS